MTTPADRPPHDVDFVVGPEPAVADAGPAHYAPRTRNVRLRLALLGGAAALALGALVGHAATQHQPQQQADLVKPRPIHTTSTIGPAGKCPAGTRCFERATPASAIAAVRSEFKGAQILSMGSWVGIAPGETKPKLLCRAIRARILRGELIILVTTSPRFDESYQTNRTSGFSVVATAVNDGYSRIVLQLTQPSGSSNATETLLKVARDPRLQALR